MAALPQDVISPKDSAALKSSGTSGGINHYDQIENKPNINMEEYKVNADKRIDNLFKEQ